jgi:hypothetical protein
MKLDETTMTLTSSGDLYGWGWNGAKHFAGIKTDSLTITTPT